MYVMFGGNHNFILQYSVFVQVQVVPFAQATYIEELLLNLRLNSYKVGIVFATYHRMRAKWTCWDGPFLEYWPLCICGYHISQYLSHLGIMSYPWRIFRGACCAYWTQFLMREWDGSYVGGSHSVLYGLIGLVLSGTTFGGIPYTR